MTPVDEELRRFDAHMDRVRGLAPKTRAGVLRVVGRLLRQCFGSGCVDIALIKPTHVRRFYAQQAVLHSKPGGAGSVVAALHGYLRYRASLGDQVHGLLGVDWTPLRTPHRCKPHAPSGCHALSPKILTHHTGAAIKHGRCAQSVVRVVAVWRLHCHPRTQEGAYVCCMIASGQRFS
jgi:hypothetical protein